MRDQTAAATKPATNFSASANHLIVPPEEIGIYKEVIDSQIQQRAYELFRRRGCGNGRDWEDWFLAEEEVVQALGVDLEVSPLSFIAVVYIEGHNPQDLRVGIEPRQLTICDAFIGEKQKATHSIACQSHPKRIFLSLELPEPVQAASASADIRHGKLLVRLPKDGVDRSSERPRF